MSVLRPAIVFVASFGTGMLVLTWAAGGFFVEVPAAIPWTVPPPDLGDRPVAVPGASGIRIGSGRLGRLEKDGRTVVGGKLVRFLDFVAEWETSAPATSREPDVSRLRLNGARIVFFPRPNEQDPTPAATEAAPGVTILSGREALLRMKEGQTPSAHLEGDCVASHHSAEGDTLVLRSEALDCRSEEQEGRETVRRVQTDRPVRIEQGDSVLTGTGLDAKLGAGSRGKSLLRIERDVAARIRETGAQPTESRILCDGAADVESLDRARRDGTQPWRATFRDNVRISDQRTATTTRANLVVVDFLETSAADRKAGARAREPRALTATGGVVIDSISAEEGAAGAYHAECREMRSYFEDAVTKVTVLEGAPVLRFEGRTQRGGDAAAQGALTLFEVRCTGPATMRERRTSAGRDAPARVTVVFEGDVVATQRAVDGGALLSEIRSPLLTIEGLRDDASKDAAKATRLNPQVIRAEQGATARFAELHARAQTITSTAANPKEPGSAQKLALVGKPAATFALEKGADPLGAAGDAKRIVLTSDGRIDVDLAPQPAPGQPKPKKGTRVAAKVTGGMTARWLADERGTATLTSKEGDAKIGWDGAIEEMHAVGDAHLVGGEDAKRRGGDLTGQTIALFRADPDAVIDAADWGKLDVRVDGTAAAPARAEFADKNSADRAHVIVAQRLLQTENGTLLVGQGDVRADLHSGAASGKPAPAPVTLTSSELRVTLDRPAEGAATPRMCVATGNVHLFDSTQEVRGDRVTYDPVRGEAEAVGSPAEIARRETAADRTDYRSYARGPLVRAWFDPKAKEGAQAFQRAALPRGGEVVRYFVEGPRGGAPAPPDKYAHRRVTATSKGPIEVTARSVSLVSDVTTVYESRSVATGSRWTSDARIDAQRLDMTTDPNVRTGQARDRIRTLTALGTPDQPARLNASSARGDRQVYGQAERIESVDGLADLHLSCPSGKSSVYAHEVATGRKFICDKIRFNLDTHEWRDAQNQRLLE